MKAYQRVSISASFFFVFTFDCMLLALVVKKIKNKKEGIMRQMK